MTEVQQQSWIKYLKNVGYYDQPEGKDLVGKVTATTRTGLIGGLLIAMYKSFNHAGFDTPSKVINLHAYYMIPMAAMGATFSVVTYAATQARGVDSPMNYALGVGAASIIGYRWTGNGNVSFHWALVGGLLGIAYKHAQQLGGELINLVALDMPHDGTWMTGKRFVDDPRPWKN